MNNKESTIVRIWSFVNLPVKIEFLMGCWCCELYIFILCVWILIDFEKAITFCFLFSFFSTTVGIVEIFSVMSAQTIKCHFPLQPSQYEFVMTVKHFCYRDILLPLSDLWKIRGHHDVHKHCFNWLCISLYIKLRHSWKRFKKNMTNKARN